MYKGITPTIELTLPEAAALGSASHVYVTVAGKDKSITKADAEIDVTHDLVNEVYTIGVFLDQQETLSFHKGAAMVQVNWTYDENGIAKRAASTIGKLTFSENLLNEVVE